MERKARLEGVDFIRLVCAIGIIVFHYSCSSESSFKPLLSFANGTWGSAIVTVFFVLSGAMLYYNYETVPSLKVFYYKRWKSIFPAFYLAFLYYYIENVFSAGQFFYRGSPWLLLESVLGMDGYLTLYGWSNYYILGEWFLGALIVLYLLYPLLLRGTKRAPVPTAALLTGLFAAAVFTELFPVDKTANLFTCVLRFYLGMLLMKYRKQFLENRLVPVLALGLCLLLYFVPLPIDSCISVCVFGFCLFLVLYFVGVKVCGNPRGKQLCANLGALTYPCFLVQHIVILKMQRLANPTAPWKVCVMLGATVVLTFVWAKVLAVVNRAVLHSPLYCRLEQKFLHA